MGISLWSFRRGRVFESWLKILKICMLKNHDLQVNIQSHILIVEQAQYCFIFHFVLQNVSIIDQTTLTYFLQLIQQFQQMSRRITNLQINHQQSSSNLVSKFPSINFTSTSRALMSLSKKQQSDNFHNFMSTQITRQMRTKLEDIDKLRQTNSIQTSLNKFRQTQKMQNKVCKTLNFVKKFDRQRIQPSSSLAKIQSKKLTRYEQQKQPQNPNRMAIRQENTNLFNGQVRYCQKKFGWAQGYAVCSHIGTLTPSNNIRICVATNLLRNSNKTKQVSFFGLYEGRNGFNRAEYMREYFHNVLINDQLFYYNFQKAVARAFEKIQRDFGYDPKYEGDYSVAACVICVIIGIRMHIIRCGAPSATISMNLGSYIKSLTFQQIQTSNYNFKQRKSVSTLANFSSKLPKQQIHIKTFELNQNFDYLILTNEGLSQIYSQNSPKNELGVRLWKQMLQDNTNIKNINKLAKMSNKLCESAVKNDGLGRCMAMIVIQFQNMKKCFEEDGQLQLPYMVNGIKMEQQEQSKDDGKQGKQGKEKNENKEKQKEEDMQRNKFFNVASKNRNGNFQINHQFIRSLSNIL